MLRRVSSTAIGTSRAIQWSASSSANIVPSCVASTSLSLVNLSGQKRWQWQSKPEDRDSETFLAQHSPYQVLGIEETANIQTIKDAHRRMTQYYAPQGPKPNKMMFDNVQKALTVLTNPKSPYFAKARPGDYTRHELLLNLMPPKKRFWMKVQTYLSLLGVVFTMYLMVYVMVLPTKKAIRAVTRT
jgi:hypothetical protein